ncbi:HAD-IA family hydrolase [Thermoproteota archaeon]
MRCVFHIRGHPNILSSHKNTLEFTKEPEVSKKGDCIVGIESDFSKKELKQLIKQHKLLRLTIKAGNLKDSINFIANPEFDDDKELVIRRSEFNSERTFGFRTDKASIDLNRKLIKRLQDPKTRAEIIIEPQIKLFIFDFDDTLEDFKECFEKTYVKISRLMEKKHGVPEKTAYKVLADVDRYFELKCVGGSPKWGDRHIWFDEFAKRTNIRLSKKEIKDLVVLYWDTVLKHAKQMPNAEKLLKYLQQRYLIALMSDTDGDLKVKMDRIRKVGLYDYFDLITTSDMTGENKPSKKFYDLILKKLKTSPEECVMVGDKPQVDLKFAKELGMKTILVKHGIWLEHETGNKFDYVDHEIKDLKEIIDIVKEEF